ncbi:MAG: class I SAM-dependent methyltransferase [Candidatus Sulfotelmatobacter sp.]
MDSSSAGVSAAKENSGIEANTSPVRRWRVKGFDLADRWLNRLGRFASAMHEGFWLGCLGADELNAVTAEHFDQSKYYASTEHNLSGFFGWEKSVVDRFFQRGSRILVAGAGGGREVLALRKAGFDAEGFECSVPLVRASEQIFERLGESKYVTFCEADGVPEGPRTYDGLVVGWTVYTHIPTKVRRVAFLQALKQRALPGSPLLVSYFAQSRASEDVLVYRTARLWRLLLRGRTEPLEVGDRISYARFVRSFTSDEVEAELRAAGFRRAHHGAEGDLGYTVGVAE